MNIKKESVILYAQVLKKCFKNKSVIEIAKELGYIVMPLNIDPRFLIANTYVSENKCIITINSTYSTRAQNVLCAHELGHTILKHPLKSNYKDTNLKNEYYANLFAVSLLFDEDDFNMPFKDMSNYTLQSILDLNIT